MAENLTGEEVSENTRESLIAISYTKPPEEPNEKDSTKKMGDNNVVKAMKREEEEEDKYRSILISISNSESPDTKAQPILPGDTKG